MGDAILDGIERKVSEMLTFEQKPERIKRESHPEIWGDHSGSGKNKCTGRFRLGEIKERRSVWLQGVEAERRGKLGFYYIAMGSCWRV